MQRTCHACGSLTQQTCHDIFFFFFVFISNLHMDWSKMVILVLLLLLPFLLSPLNFITDFDKLKQMTEFVIPLPPFSSIHMAALSLGHLLIWFFTFFSPSYFWVPFPTLLSGAFWGKGGGSCGWWEICFFLFLQELQQYCRFKESWFFPLYFSFACGLVFLDTSRIFFSCIYQTINA